MTPVPLDLPLRPSEAAELAALIFDAAERKPLTGDTRNRIGARAAALGLKSFRAFLVTLERDPLHHSTYYVAVDTAEGVPYLLHLALATAPTSSIFAKPLLIGRTREMVINAIPFGPTDREALEKFSTQLAPAFLPRPRAVHLVEAAADFAAAYYAGLWTGIRSGWRETFNAVARLTSPEQVREAAAFSTFSVDIVDAGRFCSRIRETRSALKINRPFDFEVTFQKTPSGEELAAHLQQLKSNGHGPQRVVVPEASEDLAAICRQFQCMLHSRG